MSDIGAITPAAAATPAATTAQPTKAQIQEAAQKFEAMLLRQMLAESRKTDLSGGLFSNEGTKTFREMQDANYADTAAKQGSFGFAKMIAAQLAQQTQTPATKSGG